MQTEPVSSYTQQIVNQPETQIVIVNQPETQLYDGLSKQLQANNELHKQLQHQNMQIVHRDPIYHNELTQRICNRTVRRVCMGVLCCALLLLILIIILGNLRNV